MVSYWPSYYVDSSAESNAYIKLAIERAIVLNINSFKYCGENNVDCCLSIKLIAFIYDVGNMTRPY